MRWMVQGTGCSVGRTMWPGERSSRYSESRSPMKATTCGKYVKSRGR